MTFLEDGSVMCLSDPERHILISIAWKKLNGFAAMMLKTSEIAGNMAKQIRSGMQAFNYRQLDTVTKTVAGQNAEGVIYEYEAEGISMTGESLVLKHGKELYYFHCYARTANAAESIGLFEELIATAKIS